MHPPGRSLFTVQVGTTQHLDLDAARGRFSGRVIGPEDADYDRLRTVVAGGVDRHPAAIVRVADPRDVAEAIALAREHDLPLAVRSGGHSGAGHGTVEGGLVIDVRDLNSLDIDPAARTAWAGSGVTAGEYGLAAAEHGLATGFGDTGSVGLGGILTGGGVGYLSRKLGLSIDNLLAAEIVTADGRILEVDARTHPDLFWAIRGGGGNFGVVTRFKLQLHPLDGIVGGMLILPAAIETIAGFVAAAEAAPEELTTIANVMNAPPMPFLPEAVHGKVVLMGMLAHAGDREPGLRAVEPFRALGEPLADQLRPMPYPDLFPPEPEEEYHPLAVARTMFVDHIGPAEAEVIVEQLNASDAPLRAVQIRVLGGAISRVPADATAYAHRSRRIMLNIASFYEGEHDRPSREAWVSGLVDALGQGDSAAYVNFLADEGPERVRDAYPPDTWSRLAEIKRRYDPENVFRLNQNVPPA
jgi:FAD/FMN-containing dehydrogenase